MTDGKTLCLNMIVRNETANLERCLGALADHVACWVIGDTGSTDGTQDLIRSFFAARNLPGELHSFPFENFEQARNAALDCAYASPLAYDYLLFADADMELVVEDRGFRAGLEAPGYRLIQRADSGLIYWNTRLARRDVGARYHGVTHEYLDVPGGVQELKGVWYKDHASGSNRVDKFQRDIRLLTKALKEDPENCRYLFYLAQSYRDAGQTAKAATSYAKRAAMGGWDEEAWYARLQEARCLRTLGDEGGFVRQALAAFNQRPQRAEPLYDLAKHCREKGMNHASIVFSEMGLTLPRPDQDILFLEDFIYTAGLQEEFSIAANYSRDAARKDRGFAACNWLALNREIPPGTRDLATSNLHFYVEPVAKMMPSFATRQIGFEAPASYRTTNPSIARQGDEIVLVQRTVNYTIDHAVADGDPRRYATPDGEPINTRNFLLRLDSDLAIRSSSEILAPVDMPEPAWALAQGFEDMRPFAWRGGLWCIACVRELSAEGWCDQVLARIDEGPPGPARLADWRVLRPEGPRRHEKNWMPRVGGDDLQFVYLCDPTRLVDDQARTVAETVPPIQADQFRGSSQLTAFDGGWLALVHEARVRDNQRHYRHRFVWFDAATRLAGVSRPFFFAKRGVEFAAGLAWHPDAKRLMITYGVEDSEAWIATVDAADIRRVLDDVDSLPSAGPGTGTGAQLRLAPSEIAAPARLNAAVPRAAEEPPRPPTGDDWADTASLASIFRQWGTDKVTNGYADLYECLFRKDRRRVESMLEIGIGTMLPGVHSSMVGYASAGYRPGGSLRSWRDFFPNATIYGVDVQPDTQFHDEDRIETFLCDSTDRSQVDRLMGSINGKEFDIIIDDGSHRLEDQIATLRNLYRFVSEGGTYVVEDIVNGALVHHQDKIRDVCGDDPFFFHGSRNNPLVIMKRPRTGADIEDAPRMDDAEPLHSSVPVTNRNRASKWGPATTRDRVQYWLKGEPIQNFGDFLTEALLDHVFTGDAIEPGRIHIIGSVISDDYANPKNEDKGRVVFWGCGLRNDRGLSKHFRENVKFLAVRGPLTRKALDLPDTVPIGDPGLLLPALYQPKIAEQFLGKTICVPHFSDTRGDSDLLQLSGCELLLRPNIKNSTAAIFEFIDAISSAKFVLSGSLHAAIVAAAYTKPFGFWANGFLDGPFKWQDFAASAELPCHFHTSIEPAQASYENSIAPNLVIPVLWPLLASAPFPVRPDAFARVMATDVARHGDEAFTHEIMQGGRRSEATYNLPVIAGHVANHRKGARLLHQAKKPWIPKIFHFITGLDKDFGGKQFSFIHYMAIRSALRVNHGFHAKVYYHHRPSGKYWDAIKDDVELVHIDLPTEVFGNPVEHFAHKADVLRLRILLEQGGIYLDLDTICQRPFEPLLDGRVVMGREEKILEDGSRKTVGLCNATIIAPPDAAFLRLWYEAYRDFTGGVVGDAWNKFSVQVPMALSTAHPELLRIEPAASFFWPSWDKAGIASMFSANSEYPEAFSFHLWESQSWALAKDLDLDTVATVDTTYNKIARRHLDEKDESRLPSNKSESAGQRINTDAVRAAYRVILGREPENEAAIRWHLQHAATLEALLHNFMASDEFQFRSARGGSGLQSTLLDFLSHFTPSAAVGHAKIRVGNKTGDGGYVMLDDFEKVVGALSAGIGNDVSWDLDIAARGIDVYQFDHTIAGPPATHERFRFFRRRISSKSTESSESIRSVIEKVPDSAGRMIFKIDIEGAEWEALDAVDADDLHRVAQLVGEFHGFSNATNSDWRDRANRVMAKLTDVFEIVHVHGNNWSPFHVIANVPFPDVIEVTFANRSMYKFEDSAEIYPTSIDRPNHQRRPDIFLGSLGFKPSFDGDAG